EGCPQPERRPGHASAHGDRRVRDGCGVDRSRAGPLRSRTRGADARPREARPPLRPRGPGREGRRQDRHRGRRRRRAAVSGFTDFWAGRDLWRDPMIAGVLAGAVLGYIGVFVVLKRMVFVSAALSEISGVGVAFAFWLGAVLGIDPHAHATIPLLLEPTWFSLVFACLAAALFSLRPGHRKLATETIVGLGYIISSALVQGIGVFRYELLLNLATAVVISVATRAVGALPVFAFSVLPAAAALMLTDHMRLTIALSVLFGVVSAAVGYYVSWVEQLPTGATM